MPLPVLLQFTRPSSAPAAVSGAASLAQRKPVVGATGSNSSGDISGPGPNEPASMTEAFDEPWNTTPNGRTGTDWITDGVGTNFSIVTDATAPKSASNVLQVAYPTGFGGGFSPAQAYYAEMAGLPANTGTIYMRVWIKVSANWTDNGNAGTKFVFLRPYTGEGGGPGAQTNHYIGLTSFGDFNLSVATQGPSYSEFYTSTLTKGAWHDIEMLLTLGTSGSANDGTAKVWVNGTLLVNATGIKMLYDGQSVGSGWKYLFLDPTYGGGFNTPPADLNFQIDHWYASVK